MFKIIIKTNLDSILTFITEKYIKDEKFIEFIDKFNKHRVFCVDWVLAVYEIDK